MMRALLLLLLPVGLWAGQARAECVEPAQLQQAIDRLATGLSNREHLKLAADCLASNAPAGRSSRLQVQVTAWPHSNGIKRPARNTLEQQRAQAAAQALQASIEGEAVLLQVRDPAALYMTPQRIYTFRFDLAFERILTAQASAASGELEVAFETPCISQIWLWSQKPEKAQRAQLTREDGFNVEYRMVGEVHGGLIDETLQPPHYATFEWAPNTGGKRQRIHITLDAAGTRSYRLVELVNRCADGQRPSREGVLLKLKIGYPLMGAGVGLRSEGPSGHYSASLEYDYYLWGIADDPQVGSHLIGLDLRGGPELGAGFTLQASVGAGVALLDGQAAAYYQPKLILGRRGSGLSVGLGLLGMRGGAESSLTWLLTAEWGLVLGEDPSLAARPPEGPEAQPAPL